MSDTITRPLLGFALGGPLGAFAGIASASQDRKLKKQEQAKNLSQQQVQVEAQQRFEADQAAAGAAAEERLRAIRTRRQNRSGTLLTTPGSDLTDTLG